MYYSLSGGTSAELGNEAGQLTNAALDSNVEYELVMAVMLLCVLRMGGIFAWQGGYIKGAFTLKQVGRTPTLKPTMIFSRASRSRGGMSPAARRMWLKSVPYPYYSWCGYCTSFQDRQGGYRSIFKAGEST